MFKRIKNMMAFKGIGFNLKTLIYLEPAFFLFAGIFVSFRTLYNMQLINLFWPATIWEWSIVTMCLALSMAVLSALTLLALAKGRAGVHTMAKRSFLKYSLLILYQTSALLLFVIGKQLIIVWPAASQHFFMALSGPFWRAVLVPYQAFYSLCGIYGLIFISAELLFFLLICRTAKIRKSHLTYFLALISLPWWPILILECISLLFKAYSFIVPILKSGVNKLTLWRKNVT